MGLFKKGFGKFGLAAVGGGIGFALGGPAGAKVGVGLGGSVGGQLDANAASKSERKRALGDTASQFLRLRSAAVAGGFSPLTALAATGAQGFGRLPSGVSPLISSSLLSSTANVVFDELSGERLRRENAQAVQDDLARIELEVARAGGAPGRLVSGSGRSERSAVVVPSGNPIGVIPPLPSSVLTFDKRLEGQVGVSVGALNQTFTLRDGTKVTVPVGPDIDQVVSGAVLSSAPFVGRAVGVGKFLLRSLIPPVGIPNSSSDRDFRDTVGGFGKFFIPQFLNLQ